MRKQSGLSCRSLDQGGCTLGCSAQGGVCMGIREGPATWGCGGCGCAQAQPNVIRTVQAEPPHARSSCWEEGGCGRGLQPAASALGGRPRGAHGWARSSCCREQPHTRWAGHTLAGPGSNTQHPGGWWDGQKTGGPGEPLPALLGARVVRRRAQKTSGPLPGSKCIPSLLLGRGGAGEEQLVDDQRDHGARDGDRRRLQGRLAVHDAPSGDRQRSD